MNDVIRKWFTNKLSIHYEVSKEMEKEKVYIKYSIASIFNRVGRELEDKYGDTIIRQERQGHYVRRDLYLYVFSEEELKAFVKDIREAKEMEIIFNWFQWQINQLKGAVNRDEAVVFDVEYSWEFNATLIAICRFSIMYKGNVYTIYDVRKE